MTDGQAHPPYAGRLELTWTNKDRTLLAHEDGSYEWVDPSDYRVAEVRLLHDVTTVGETAPDDRRAADNLLIRGDALHVLQALNRIPEFANEYVGKVRLVYIDPPFNTGQAFEHYDDNLEHSVWLTMLRDRLVQIKPLLAPNGSVWVHLDDAEVHHCRAVLDEVFGADHFVGSVIWKRRNDPRNTARFISMDHDTLLVYSAHPEGSSFNQLPRTDSMDAAYTNPDADHRGVWRRSDLAARNFYSRGLYSIETPSGRLIGGPPSGSYWRVSEDELRRLDSDGRIYWGSKGDSRPYLKRFLTEVNAGRVSSSVWPPEEVGFVRNGKEEVRALVGDVFATPKPERLILRIVQMSTDPGDIVLDCFAGSGTTAAVAHKMRRRWVGVEWSAETIESFTLPRLQKVVAGDDPGGVTDGCAWRGGGGFRLLDVGPSMFEVVDGRVYLATWATNGALAEATAAQLGYEFTSDPPFSGTKGRTRLAVVDGLVNEAVIRLLMDALPEGERLCVCGTAFDPAVRQVLRELRPGSTMKKVPAALLDEYRASRRERLRLASTLDWTEASALLSSEADAEVAGP